MPEIVANVHMHTTYSDGNTTHAGIAAAALKTDVDVVIVTDHNVWVNGVDRFYQEKDRRVLLLAAEEIHDQNRQPQKNHLLVLGAGRELAPFAPDPQKLLDQVEQLEGVAFLAHPNETALPAFGEDDISWVSWNVHGYTGLEVWNHLSELKTAIHNSLPHAMFYAFFPRYYPVGPHPASLAKWDELTAQGKQLVAIGGSDAHALKARLGPFRRVLFPYEFHFRCVNNHLILPQPLSGELLVDRRMVLDAFRKGNCFIGYDLPASTRGFNFSARSRSRSVLMGEEIRLEDGITLQIRLPFPTECHLIRNGQVIRTWNDREILAQTISQPGVYRVECYVNYLGKRRGWIFSNPIYVLTAD